LEQFDYNDILSDNFKRNVPNFLTIIRLVGSPLFLPLLIVYLLPYNLFWLNCIVTIFFCLLAATDFFDGYFARKFNQETALGKVLDPIADKFLLYATLVALLAAHKIFFYWVILFIGREFFMMGLRQIALENNFSVPVSMLGKIKTAVQMFMLSIIILNPYQARGLAGSGWNGIELSLILVSLILSLASAAHYYRYFMRLWKEKERQMPRESIDDIVSDNF
jgi:CDP-diacylglycerol--glycerol-3-phosphate 3-phosphatidyltransferase